MSYYVGPVLLLLSATFEASVLPMFRIGGLQPNPTLVLLVAWLMVRGDREAFLFIPIAGILLGLVDSAPMGTALLALAPLALLHDVRGSRLSETGFPLTALFTVVMTVVYNLVYLLVFTIDGQAGSWMVAFTHSIIPSTLLNVVILVPIYAILRATKGEPRRASYYA